MKKQNVMLVPLKGCDGCMKTCKHNGSVATGWADDNTPKGMKYKCNSVLDPSFVVPMATDVTFVHGAADAGA